MVITKPIGGQVIKPEFQNGFIGAIFKAYNEHRHLVLRPDDIWLAITTALAHYINKHAEKMRGTFVEHEDKKELVIEKCCDQGVPGLRVEDWCEMVDKISCEIEKNTKADARKLIEPSFSTTTPTIKTVGQVVLMGAMKTYFDYKMIFFRCGIPKVTLEGTLQDWIELRSKAKQLKKLDSDDLKHWADLLDTVVVQLIDSYSGNIDVDFWGGICHLNTWGSGHAEFLQGWINVFIPFHIDSGSYLLRECKAYTMNEHCGSWCAINIKEIPPSATEVPVTIEDRVMDRTYNTIFYGGHIAFVYNEADDTIRPSLDWAIVDVTKTVTGQGKYANRLFQFRDPIIFEYGHSA